MLKDDILMAMLNKCTRLNDPNMPDLPLVGEVDLNADLNCMPPLPPLPTAKEDNDADADVDKRL